MVWAGGEDVPSRSTPLARQEPRCSQDLGGGSWANEVECQALQEALKSAGGQQNPGRSPTRFTKSCLLPADFDFPPVSYLNPCRTACSTALQKRSISPRVV